MDSRDFWIGTVLLVLPFAIFVAMFSYWPSSDGSAFEKWLAATRDVVALNQKLAVDVGTYDEALAKAASNAGTPEEKKVSEQAVTSATEALKGTKADLKEARERQRKEYETIAAANGAVTFSQEARLCILVVLAGALGGSISAARGFAFHFGNKDYDAAWRWWYLLRIPTGCGIAFVLYAVLRAGLVPWKLDDAGKTLDHVNPYGFVAIGALGGMFANEAFEKLKAVLSAILTSSSPSIPPTPKPEIKSVALTQANDRHAITIAGQNFGKGASVKVDGVAWAVDAKDVTVSEIKAKGDVGLADPPTEIKIEVTIPGPPSQTAKWTGPVG